MHRLLSTALALIILLTLAFQSLALPKVGFERDIDRALRQEKNEDYEDAREYWRDVIENGLVLLESSPDNCDYLLGTARAYYGIDDYAKAIELWDRFLEEKGKLGAMNVPDNNPFVFVYLGLAHGKLGDRDNALKYWRMVPESAGPTYSVIREQMAALQGQEAQ